MGSPATHTPRRRPPMRHRHERHESGPRSHMTSERPLISVTMTTPNRADLLLQRSIPSMLHQTYANWEMLIRGDGAGRDTEFGIDWFNDRRITYKRLPRRLYGSPQGQWAVGSTDALNDRLDAAKRDYLAHPGDDDEMLPIHLETQRRMLRKGPTA